MASTPSDLLGSSHYQQQSQQPSRNSPAQKPFPNTAQQYYHSQPNVPSAYSAVGASPASGAQGLVPQRSTPQHGIHGSAVQSHQNTMAPVSHFPSHSSQANIDLEARGPPAVLMSTAGTAQRSGGTGSTASYNSTKSEIVHTFTRTIHPKDIKGNLNNQPAYRRAHPEGATYRICNPNFKYESSRNPRRVLTKPSKGVKNDGYDNEDSDYILYVNDILGSEEAGHK
ncbi:hypothetical protein ABW19_dt0206014 [Dactylella cylindrospora]|nr:hypothetical protein ABW19_dt0206014 [Dactylella cylindrospora]